MQLTFEQIDQLKRQYTDKLVAVDNDRPELQRFSGITGKVKTVNMSGRALVEFEANNNIGWYDIDLDFLRVIDQPLPKIEAKAEPALAKEAALQPSPRRICRGQGCSRPKSRPAAAKPAAAGRSFGRSRYRLAAAGLDGKAAAAGPAAPAAKKPPAEKPAAAKPAAAGGKMSTADILAAARAKKQSGRKNSQPKSNRP